MTHRHRRWKESGPLPFWGPVATGDQQNRAAHGNVRYRQTCRCGAVRDVLRNQGHEERGPWIEPERPTPSTIDRSGMSDDWPATGPAMFS